MEKGEAIEHPWVNKAIENAQRKVEGRNFDIRKQLLEYDDVANDQRKVVYQQRDELMDEDDISETIQNLCEDVLSGVIDSYIPPQSLEEQWDIPGLTAALKETFDADMPVQQWLDEDDDLHEETLRQRITELLNQAYQEKAVAVGEDQMKYIEKACKPSHRRQTSSSSMRSLVALMTRDRLLTLKQRQNQPSPMCARIARSAVTNPVPAVQARNTNNAMASCSEDSGSR